ncbi:MAG: AAA family ATPase [Clostridiales bacterium]|nr:AAA family ATPase [Clostridiales bacterium]
MRYLQKVVIEGFQSHDHTAIELSPTLTVLTGPSDSGKSAVIRAIRWVFHNAPSGDAFLRFNQGPARVSLTFSDGVTITRERSGKTNRYILSLPGEEPRVFEGFGRDVPEPVRDVLPQSAYHIQGQLEAPFFLGLPPSQQAEMLGRINGMNILTRAAKEARRLALRAREEAQRQKETRDRLQTALSAYQDLDQEEVLLEKIEALLAALEATDAQARVLSDLQARALRLMEERRMIETRLEELPLAALHAARDALSRAEDILRKSEALRRLAGPAKTLGTRREELRNTLQVLPAREPLLTLQTALSAVSEKLSAFSRLKARMERIRTAASEIETRLASLPVLPDLSRLAPLLQRTETLRRLETRARELRKQKAATEKALAEAGAEVERLLGQYRTLLSQAGRCPTCGQPVQPSHLATCGIPLAEGGGSRGTDRQTSGTAASG